MRVRLGVLGYLVLSCLVLTLSASANDSAIVGVGGTLRPMQGEHPSVRMVRENISIKVGPENSTTMVDFVFRNEGPATTVRMGFPEGGSGDFSPEKLRAKSGFLNFATWVDGQRVSAKRTAFTTTDTQDYDAYWVKQVRFGRNQTRRVRVRYTAPLGVTTAPSKFVTYNFTGGNWRGEVAESTLTVTVNTPGTHIVFQSQNENLPQAQTRFRENRGFFRWRNWQAEATFSLHLIETMQGWLAESQAALPYSSAMNYLFTVINPGASKPSLNAWLPPAVLRNGVTFIRLNNLHDWVNQQTADGKSAKLSWNASTKKTVLNAAPHTFTFTPGEKQMAFNGRVLPLRAAPFTAHDHSGGRLYVPLAPIITALGGKITVDAEDHHLEYSAPMG